MLAHKASLQKGQPKAERQQSGSLGSIPSLHALHEHEEEDGDEDDNEGAPGIMQLTSLRSIGPATIDCRSSFAQCTHDMRHDIAMRYVCGWSPCSRADASS